MELLKTSLEKKFELLLAEIEVKNFTTFEITRIMEPLTEIYYKHQEIEELQHCKLKGKFIRQNVIRFVILILLSIIIIKYYHEFQWFLMVMGRIFLIQLLPYWNWIPLYNRPCLIEWNNYKISQLETSITIDLDTTFTENCLLCKFLDKTPFVVNMTFSNIQRSYLNRGLPVIIRDSHMPQNFHEIITRIYKTVPEFLDYLPCDIWTNILLTKFFHLEIALNIIQNNLITPFGMDKWFLQFRNCQFDALKFSRAVTMKPYYYPKHLQPFYSSWLLLSHNYDDDAFHFIVVHGLIIIQQFSGNIEILLKPKYPCPDYDCKSLEIFLRSGESLTFTTDLWSLNYKFLAQPTITTITTIIEIEMD